MRSLFIMLALMLCTMQATYSKITLPALISDGMVLQRNQRVAIWGWAEGGETIVVTFNHKSYKTKCTTNEWKIWLPAMPAGGPYTINIQGTNQIVINDVLIGDVWLCSGQSNMEYILKRSEVKYADDIAHADNEQIRQFAAKANWSYTVETDVKSNGWKNATPQNVLNFTAVGYFFAKSLFAKYHVPIGLINSSYGGTPIESWMSESGLTGFPALITQFNNYKDPQKVDAELELNRTRSTTWYNTAAKADAGRNGLTGLPLWSADTSNSLSWSNIHVPGFWQDQKLKGNGIVWYRKRLLLNPGSIKKDALLELGNIYQEDSTYFNGVKIGSTNSQYLARRYTIPASLVKNGMNTIIVRVLNKEGPGGFLADKPYRITINRLVISLSGDWDFRVGANMSPLASDGIKQFSREPIVLYNAMIAPLTAYAIKGVVWYQGENNTGNATRYKALLPRLIKDWRSKWRQKDLPFVYAQLANYLPVIDHPSDSHWAELREAQFNTLAVPHTAMAVIHDTGEWNDVHPVNKKDVGMRLSIAAQHIAYHEPDLVYSGPLYRSAKILHHKIAITFDTFGSKLIAQGGNNLNHFAIAGNDKKFVWAHAIIAGNKVIVWSEQVSNPVAVRYAWADNPQGANLYNKEGLPASSFRTDNWVTTSFSVN